MFPRIMRRFLFRSFLACCLALSSLFLLHAPSAAKTPPSYKDLVFPPLAAVHLPNYRREVLDNGLVVYLMEDHDLPLVNGTAFVRVGDRW